MNRNLLLLACAGAALVAVLWKDDASLPTTRAQPEALPPVEDEAERADVHAAPVEMQAAHPPEESPDEPAATRTSVAATEATSVLPPECRAEIQQLQQEEDETFDAFNALALELQERGEKASSDPRFSELRARYRECIRRTDEVVLRCFTPERIALVPWRDYLVSGQTDAWIGGKDVPGFTRKHGPGVMRLGGVAADSKFDALISIGDQEVWRDFEVDMEFTIERGSFDVFFRLPHTWQENVYSLTMDASGGGGALEPGRSHAFTFRIRASEFLYGNESDGSAPTVDPISWTKPRKGAFGISIPAGAEVVFTRLRVKVLRSNAG